MKFTEEHEQLRKTVRDVVDKEINPYVEEWEQEGLFPARTVFKTLGKLGLLGVTKPEEFGGMGLDYSYGMVVSEELGRIRCGGVPMAIGVQTDMATPALARWGSDELRKEFLAPAIAGDAVSCIAVSEVGGGSDVAALKTSAVKDGDDYVINGSKMWITNSTQADWACVLVNTSDAPAHQNKSLVVVPMDTKGVTVSERLKKLGMHSSDTAQVFFENVRVPQRNRIGQEGMGFTMQMIQFQEERLFAAVSGLRGMESLIQQTADYCRERHAFGKPLLANQYMHFRLAELQTEIEALRALSYRACEEYIGGNNVTLLASMAKLKAGRLSREVADSCLQFWGGMGFMWDNPASRALRDGRLASIGGGADEVMLGIISKLLNLVPKRPKK